MKTFALAIGAAAVATIAMPASAERHYTNITRCTRYHHGRCVQWQRLTRRQARRAGYRVGYNFGPGYGYTEFGALPQPMVMRYHLGDNFRYVNRDGFVYVVNPNSYRVVRVIAVP